jgi:hypothetical protein
MHHSLQDTNARADFTWKKLLGLVLVSSATLLYWSWGRSFPVHFMWDQDMIHTVDTLLIRSGELPDHVNHPGFGNYLVWTFTHSLAHSLGFIDAWKLSTLSNAQNPLLLSFELTDFLRAHSALLVGALALLCFVFFNASGSMWLGAALLMQGGLVYHATVTRTETYAVLFWLVGLAVGLRSAHPWRFYAVGLCFGLAFFTKIQALILLIFGVAWVLSFEQPFRRANVRAKLEAGALLMLATVTLVAVQRFELPKPDFATFTSSYAWNSAASLWLLVSAVPVGLALSSRKNPALNQMLWGAAGVGGLHFLIYKRPEQALQYLGVNLKMVFFRTNYQNVQAIGIAKTLHRLGECMIQTPLLWMFHGAVLAAWIAKCIRREPRAERLKKLAICLAIEGLLFAHVALGTRVILRDWIWFELPLLLWTVALLAELALARIPLVAAGILLCAIQMLSVHKMYELTLESHREYGYQAGRWTDRVYPGRGDRYREILAKHASQFGEALAQAARVRAIQRDLRLTCANFAVSLAQVGVVPEAFRGAPATRSKLSGFDWVRLNRGATPAAPAWSERDLALQGDPPRTQQQTSRELFTLRGRSDEEIVLVYARNAGAIPPPAPLPQFHLNGYEDPREGHGLYPLPQLLGSDARLYRLVRGVNLKAEQLPDWILLRQR